MDGTTLLGRLHHVGLVVASIEKALPGFLQSLGSQATTGVIHDPLQLVKVLFLRTSAAEPVLIELIEPAAEDSPVRRFLEKGGGMNHMCYQVPDLGRAIQEMQSRGAAVVNPPKPAVAFDGRRVAWMMTRQWLLIELLEEDLVNHVS
jgi:methylmalonyl-CoA/ethylmalonyl-CoA epimerase